MILVLHHVSSTNAELMGADESAVSSSMNSNGNPAINSVGSHDVGDALATLASAALNRQQSTKVCLTLSLSDKSISFIW